MQQRTTYREVTPAAIIAGVGIGCLMTATFSYAGMVLGFSLGGSTIAAILGWGFLRVLLRRGTILENNIVQTVASAVNTTSSGVIFTVPVLFLLGVGFNPWAMGLACMAGAVLGVGFIIPLRRQMIDIEKLTFPSGIAVATILKSPGEGVRKSLVILATAVVAALISFAQRTHQLDLTAGPLIPEEIDLGHWMGLPPYFENIWAISLLSLGVGFIAGRNGLVVLIGGILSYWIITPLVVRFGWDPATPGFDPDTVAGAIHDTITRPLGIGMLVGGALAGVALSFPALKASILGLEAARRARKAKKADPLAHHHHNNSDQSDYSDPTDSARRQRTATTRTSLSLPEPEDMPIEVLYGAIGFAVAVLFLAAHLGGLGWFPSLLAAALGTLWLWLAGIIVAQATGMTDWSPISGMALLAVVLLLYVTGQIVLPTVMVGAAVCVAVSECADMMQDLKTGHLVGSRPRMQQWTQLALAPIGPMIAIGVVMLLWKSGGIDPETGRIVPGFGPDTKIPAPQATALKSVIEAVLAEGIDLWRYGSGALVGALLSMSGVPGLGVLVGISMYLGLSLILPYGLGAVLRTVLQWRGKEKGCREWGIPAAVGLIVGDALMTLLMALLVVVGVAHP